MHIPAWKRKEQSKNVSKRYVLEGVKFGNFFQIKFAKFCMCALCTEEAGSQPPQVPLVDKPRPDSTVVPPATCRLVRRGEGAALGGAEFFAA